MLRGSKILMMMILGGGTPPPTLTSLHGWLTTWVTVVDYSYFAVLRVAIAYPFAWSLLRSQANDFCFLTCLRVSALC